MRNIVNKTLIIFSLFYFIAINANASVVLGGTRVIYEGDKKEASITVRNDETSAF